MASINNLREWARSELKMANQDSAVLDADLILGHVLNLNKVDILLNKEKEIAHSEEGKIKALVERRKKHEPIAYLIGKKEFYGRDFIVTPACLIPRPETELLVDKCLDVFTSIDLSKKILFLDVGVGSGAIILTVMEELKKKFNKQQLSQISPVGLDISEEALKVAKLNSIRLGLDVAFYQSDLLHHVIESSGNSELDHVTESSSSSLSAYYDYKIIVANLPYISPNDVLPVDVEIYEPQSALRAADDGFGLIFKLIRQCFGMNNCLADCKAKLLLEIGINQADQVKSYALSQGAKNIESFRDLQGIERVISFYL